MIKCNDEDKEKYKNESFIEDMRISIKKHEISVDELMIHTAKTYIHTAFHSGATIEQVLEYFQFLWDSYTNYIQTKEKNNDQMET
jgi:hypothetical protein